MGRNITMLAAAAVLLCACSAHEEPPASAHTDSTQSDAKKDGKPQVRTELDAIRNTGKIGYSGDAVANKVQGALDTNAERPGQLDDQLQDSE